MSLRRRIMLLVAIGLIAATAPLGVMGIGMLRAATDRILEERLTMVRATADHLDERVTQGWQQLDRVSRQVSPLWAAGDLNGVRGVVATVAPQLTQLTLFSGGVVLIDRTGRVVIREPAGVPLPLPPLRDVPSVQHTLTSGFPGASPLLEIADEVHVVIFTVAVRAPTGTTVGVLGGIIDLAKSPLQVFVEGMAVGGSGHAVIVNREGFVLASTDPGELFTRDEHPEFFARLIAGGRALVRPTEENHGAAAPPEIHIMASTPLTSVPWGLAIGQNEAETFGPVRRLRDRIILFGLAVLLSALLFAWLDTGAVAAPLRLLKEGAEAIAGGDLGRQITVRRGDEIGTLANSFETMRLRLLDSLEEIRRRAGASQSLYEIGTEVLSLQDRDAVLQSVAVRAVSLLRTDVAAICLLDESGKTARVTAVAGAAAALRKGQYVSPVPAAEVELACPICPYLEERYRATHRVAPLMISGRRVGALCVAGEVDHTFSTEDREVLHGLANLAAIAVENARLQERVQSVAVLEERERLAREMHDSVGQVLGYVNTKAQAVKVLLDVGKNAEAQAQLAQLEQAARGVYADLREAILGLRTETSPDRRLIAVLQEYVRRFSELSGVTTELRTEGDPARYVFSPTAELHLLRIIQEALTNVRKHAGAGRAWVRFSERDGGLTVTVGDDGLGFDPGRLQSGAWPRFGLQMMRERAEAIGGTFAVRSRDGSGTEVEVRLPAPQEGMTDARPAGG